MEPVLCADSHGDVSFSGRSVRQEHFQRPLLVQEVQQLGDVALIVFITQEAGLSLHRYGGLRCTLHPVSDRGEKRHHGECLNSQGCHQRLDEDGGDLLQRLSDELPADNVPEGLDDVVRDFRIHAAGLALQDAGGCQEHNDTGAGTDRCHSDIPDAGVLVGGCRGHGCEVCEFSEGLAHLFQQDLRISRPGVDPGLDPSPVPLPELLGLHEVVHIVAVTLLRGDAPGRGMGLIDEVQLGESRHIISNGCGRDRYAEFAEQCLGAHRFTSGNVLFHNGTQNFFSACR